MTLSSAPTAEILRHPEGAMPESSRGAPAPKWVAPLSSLVWSWVWPGWEWVPMPSPTPRPRLWSAGSRRSEGSSGSAGTAGSGRCQRRDRANGPSGTVTATSIVASTALNSPPDPAVGTVLVAKTSCPAGKVLLSGGAQVSAPGINVDRNVELRSSYPLSTSECRQLPSLPDHSGREVS